VAGDGGFMFNAQELATAALHEIGAITVVFNDGAYGNVRRTQRDQFEGRVIASELRNPDFQLLAQSFGIRAWRAEGPGGLRTALGEALRNDRPGLVEVPVGEMADPWPLLMRA
jgi:acetolactate synthase-1/2/3 large subunit